MVSEAKRRWAGRGMAGEVGFLAVSHIGDANSYVSIYRAGTDRVTLMKARGAKRSRERGSPATPTRPRPRLLSPDRRRGSGG